MGPVRSSRGDEKNRLHGGKKMPSRHLTSLLIRQQRDERAIMLQPQHDDYPGRLCHRGFRLA